MSGTANDPGATRTLDEISDYLARGRIPFDPVIEETPEGRNALQSLERVAQLSRDLVAADALALPAPADGWFDRIVTSIRSEMRAGRDLPIAHPDPRVRLSVTEGAVRALLRSAGDAVPGVIMGSCRIDGEAAVAGAPVEVSVTASVAWGVSIPPAASALREALTTALVEHTELNVVAVNIAVEKLHLTDETRTA